MAKDLQAAGIDKLALPLIVAVESQRILAHSQELS
jgi:hypothetical protein